MWRFVVWVMGLLVLSACAGSIQPREVHRDRFEPWSGDVPEYRLQSGDELEVRLVYTPEFSDRVVVAPDGLIYLSMIGALKAAGRTPTELAQAIEQAYAKDLRQPNTVVVPRSFGSQMVYVGGEVQKPGLLALAPQMGVLQAVMAAGGLAVTANPDNVILLRRTKRDTPMLRVIKLRSVIEGTDLGEDVPLQRFDIVFVPRSGIAELDLWIDQHINQIIPHQAGFSYSLQGK